MFKEFCEWLFPKVFEIEARIPYENEEYKTAYQQRALAFIGERLFSFWTYKKALEGKILTELPNRIYDDFKPLTDAEER